MATYKSKGGSLMRIIIAGGRDFDNYYLAKERISFFLKNIDEPIEIVSGRCSTGKHTFTTKEGVRVYGADGLGERYAQEHNIPVTAIPAKWDEYGKRAGGIRNTESAKYAGPTGKLIAFWDKKSPGTADMIKKAEANGLTARKVIYQY